MTDQQRPPTPESAGDELARLRRLAIVDELLTTLIGVLDVREVFTRVSEVVGRVLEHDAIALPVITEDRQHAILFATAGPAALAYPRHHPIPDTAQYLLTDPWEFEIVDDLQSHPDREPYSASLGYRSLLRVPIRLHDEVAALLVVLSRTPAVYKPVHAVLARRIADYVALALSHQRLADRARIVEELRARTATLELLDEMLVTLIDTGELPEVFDRISAIARKVLPHDTVMLNVMLADDRHARTYAISGADNKPFPGVYAIPEAIVQDKTWDHTISDDLPSDPVWSTQESAKRGYRSALRVAIRIEGRLVAGLSFLSFAPGKYKESDLLVARRIGDRIALHMTE